MGQLPSQKSKVGAERGKKLHSLAEQYLLTPPKFEGERFMEFVESNGLWEHDLRHGIRSANENDYLVELRELAHTPNSGVEILIEQEFHMDPVFLGFIDLVVLDRRSGDLKVSIHDHKFTADKRYIPELDSAMSDYQTVIYSKVLSSFFSVKSVTFSYDYYGTKYKWQKSLTFELTASEISDKWLDVLYDTGRVLDNYKIPNGSLTKPNYISCQMYGGCEFKNLCFGEESK